MENIARPARDISVRVALASPHLRRFLAGRLTGDSFSYGSGIYRGDDGGDVDGRGGGYGGHDDDADTTVSIPGYAAGRSVYAHAIVSTQLEAFNRG